MLADIEQLSAEEVRAGPGSRVHLPSDREGCAEVFFVLEGELTFLLAGDEHRVGPETWVFVPSALAPASPLVGGELTRLLHFFLPSSEPGSEVVIRRAGGDEGETIGGRTPDRRATLLLDTDELTVTEFAYGPGKRGADLHVHHTHADAFFVLEGELAVRTRGGTLAATAGTLVVLPPNVAHGFDNGPARSRFFNLHVPASGFADYLRGRNPGFDQHDPPADGGVDPAAIVTARLSQ